MCRIQHALVRWGTLGYAENVGSQCHPLRQLYAHKRLLGLLTNLDRSALAAYCGAYALWAEATEAIQKYGTMVKSPSHALSASRVSPSCHYHRRRQCRPATTCPRP